MGSRYNGIATSCDAAVSQPILFIFVVACLVSGIILFRVLKSGQGKMHVGFQLSFLAAYWMNHLFALPGYFIPGYCGISPEFEVPGAWVTLYGLLGFVAGALFLPRLFGVRQPQNFRNAPTEVPSSLRNGLVILGLLFFAATRVVGEGGFTGFQAIFSGGQQLLVVAVVLNIWEAARKKRYRTVAFWVAFSFVFPFETIISMGFIGFGIASMFPVLIFATTCIGRRSYSKIVLAAVVSLYLGLTLWVNYARERNQIRESVWGGDRFSGRVEAFAQTFKHFEWLSMDNPTHMDAIGGRLNQTWLVGAGVVYIENTQEWAHGETLKYAALSFIPRLLWPNKPTQGGSSLISRYTGQQFSEGTSVPMGQVLEFYVNYGSWMVFFGFTAIGGLLGYMDTAAHNALNTGAFNRFITCFLIGIACQQVGHDLPPMVVGAVVGILLTSGLQMFMRMRAKRKQNDAVRPAVTTGILPSRTNPYAHWRY
ncbi:MAG: hypothetical protein JOZ22_20055 [Acidobacteriia bacterium]|nr:hypothetical protein [Terriglobia bacterium]